MDKLFLLELENSFPKIRYSAGSKKRAMAVDRLQKLMTSDEGLKKSLKTIQVVVLSKKDWHKSLNYSYGLAQARRTKNLLTLFVPKDYTAKFVQKFDNYIFISAGNKIRAKGAIHEFFDVYILYVIIAAIYRAEAESPLAAAKLFWQIIDDIDSAELSSRVRSWVRLFDFHYDETLQKTARSRLSLTKRLILDCHYLAQSVK